MRNAQRRCVPHIARGILQQHSYQEGGGEGRRPRHVRPTYVSMGGEELPMAFTCWLSAIRTAR